MKVLFILSTLFVLKVFTQQCGTTEQGICNEFANEYKMHTCDREQCCATGHFEGVDQDEVYICDKPCDEAVTAACTKFLADHNEFELCGYIDEPDSDCELIAPPPTKA
ncbi:unnamed protein product [Cunninghamella echinulata]